MGGQAQVTMEPCAWCGVEGDTDFMEDVDTTSGERMYLHMECLRPWLERRMREVAH